MIIRDRPSGIQLFFILRGSILPRIMRILVINIALAAVVTALHATSFPLKVTLTPIPFTLIGLALAIFLGFRNSAAYDRFWEGRKLWGQLVYDCRNLARQCRSLIAEEAPPEPGAGLEDASTRMIYRAIAFAHTLRQALRGSSDLAEIKGFLREEDWRELGKPANNLHLLMLQMGRDLRLCLDRGRINAPLAAVVDATLSSMVVAATGCERIRNTPIPFSYSLLLHRTAYLYCFLLPFGLVDLTGFMTPLVVAIVAYTFFGLDALGDEIEEPFGTSENDLPLDALCRTIEIDMRRSAGETDLPSPLNPVNYWLG